MNDDSITLDVRGPVAVVELARPRARNAMREIEWALLRAVVEETDQRDDVRAVVLTGSGGFFCAGFDIKYHRPGPPDRSLPLVHAALLSLLNIRKPVVAAVQGGAVGAGWSMALACDLVVAADDSFFAPPFVERGLVPDVGLAWLLANSVGFHRATELILLSGRMPAQEGQRLGIVHEVVANDQVQEAALALAERLAALPARTARLARLMLRRALASSLETMLMHEWVDVSFNEADEGTLEARRDFLGSLGTSGSTATPAARLS